MEKHDKHIGSVPHCSPDVCGDDDEEVFFGLAKSTEKKKAQKLKARRTVLYCPGFHGNLEELDWAEKELSDGPLIVARQVSEFESSAVDQDTSVSSHESNVKFPSEGSDSGVDCSRSEKLDESCSIGEEERTSIGLNTAKASLSVSPTLGKCSESTDVSLRSDGSGADGATFHSLTSCQETDILLNPSQRPSVVMISTIANKYTKPNSVIDSVLPPSEVLVNKYSAFSVYKSPSKYTSNPQKPPGPSPNNPSSVFRDLSIQTSMLVGTESHTEIPQQKQFFTRVVDNDFKLSPKRKNVKPEFKYLSPHRVTETCSVGLAAKDIWRNVVKESDKSMRQPCSHGTQTENNDEEFDDLLNQSTKQIYDAAQTQSNDACTLTIRNKTAIGNENGKTSSSTQSPIRNLAAQFSTVSMDTHKSEPLSDSSQLLQFNSFETTKSDSSLKWSAYRDCDVMPSNGQGVDDISSDIASMNLCEPFNILHMPPEMLPLLGKSNASNISQSVSEIDTDQQDMSTHYRQQVLSSHAEKGDNCSGDSARNITMTRANLNKHVCFKDGPDSIINNTEESNSSTEASEAGSTSTDSDSTLNADIIKALCMPFVDNKPDLPSLGTPSRAQEVVDTKTLSNNRNMQSVSCATPRNSKNCDAEQNITKTRGSGVASSYNVNTRPQSQLSGHKPIVYNKTEADRNITKTRGNVCFTASSESSITDAKNEMPTINTSLKSGENLQLSSLQLGANQDESSLHSEDISSGNSIFSDSTIDSSPRYNSDVSDADLENYYLNLIDSEIKHEASANVVSRPISVTDSDSSSATGKHENIMPGQYLSPEDFLKPGSQTVSRSSPHISATHVLRNRGNKNSKICNKSSGSAITVSDLQKLHASKPFHKNLQESRRTPTPVKGRCLKVKPVMTSSSREAITDHYPTPSTPQVVMKRSRENVNGHYHTPSTPQPEQKKSKYEAPSKFSSQSRNNSQTPLQTSKVRTPVGRSIKTPTHALENKVYPKSPMPLQVKNANITQTPTTPRINTPIQQHSSNKSTTPVSTHTPHSQQCTPLVIDTPVKVTDGSSMRRDMTPISHLIQTLTGGSKKKKKGCYACENTPPFGDLSAPSGKCELHDKSPLSLPQSPVKTPQKCSRSPAGRLHQSSVGKSPVLCCDFRSADELTEKDLDRITRMHTVCNGTQMVDIVNFTASPMIIKHYPPPKEADKVHWKTDDDEINERAQNSTCRLSNSRPILQKKPDSHEYPFNNEAPSPIVLTRIRRSNTLARYAITISDKDEVKHTAL